MVEYVILYCISKQSSWNHHPDLRSSTMIYDQLPPRSPDSGGGPRSMWQLMVDPDGGSGQWLWTIVASDLDGGSWSWWLLTLDYNNNKTAWYIVFLLRYSIITDNNLSTHWPSVMLQSVYYNQCRKYPYLSDVLLYTWHLLHFCPSWERDPSHVALWGFYFLFTLLKGFFCSFSFLLLRAKGRGCHTLLKPYETNCDLWIWARWILLLIVKCINNESCNDI